MRILIINPNSSTKVTNDIKHVISSDTVDFEFYTAPSSAPLEIDNDDTAKISESVVLPDLLSGHYLDRFDGFLVGCFSNHPLIQSLKQYTSKPIMGIMQACLTYHLVNNHNSIIITSFKSWEPLLDTAIKEFYRTKELPANIRPTKSFDINVSNLNSPEVFGEIVDKTREIIGDDINCVLLGCAGMAGLDEKLLEKFPGVVFVDSVKIGVEVLVSLVKFDKVVRSQPV